MDSNRTFKKGYGTFFGVTDMFTKKKAAEVTTAPDSSSPNASPEERPATSPNPTAENLPDKQNRLCGKPLSRKAWTLLIIMFTSVCLAVGLLAGLLTRPGHAQSASPPNIVFIMTDDQDRLLNSTDYMPALQRELFSKGTEFTKHYTTMALCCPSRSALLRGQQVHNTNITNVVMPGYATPRDDPARGTGTDILAPQWRIQQMGPFRPGPGLSAELVEGSRVQDRV